MSTPVPRCNAYPACDCVCQEFCPPQLHLLMLMTHDRGQAERGARIISMLLREEARLRNEHARLAPENIERGIALWARAAQVASIRKGLQIEQARYEAKP